MDGESLKFVLNCARSWRATRTINVIVGGTVTVIQHYYRKTPSQRFPVDLCINGARRNAVSFGKRSWRTEL